MMCVLGESFQHQVRGRSLSRRGGNYNDIIFSFVQTLKIFVLLSQEEWR